MTGTRRPTLITNPADDTVFHDDAVTALQEGQSAGGYEEILRRDYPMALVRPRDLAGELTVVWYVYREGHWVARHDRDQE